jgi:hypothetical protein
MRMLDLFAGELGWARVFAERGWDVTAVDLKRPSSIPAGMQFIEMDVRSLRRDFCKGFNFICASTPCEEFSKFGMRCFFPDPPYPSLGIKLFNYTREMLWKSGAPWLMENVNVAQKFIGYANGHCGPFYLWGTGAPPLIPQGIIKGMTRKALGHYDYEGEPGWNTKNERAERRQNGDNAASIAATIPPELANCVAEYAERLLESKVTA